ncbi:MAG TPA: ExeM/NucH family extracellular endonuclease [Acidimicrobiia bacterium]|nr:ExeM/NucH family extracellular endonuclease [Acidimicrobiia bacterium]
MKLRHLATLAAFALVASLMPVVAFAAGEGITINEIRIDQPGADTDEYFELTGDPNASLDGLTYLVIGDGAGGSGVIEAVVDLDGNSLDEDGFFVAAESTFTLGTPDLVTNLNFENGDNVTHLLVRDFTGANGDDLDNNDDGTLDLTPWAEIVDLIALIVEENPPSTTEYHYGPPTVGPDGSFVPGHVFDCDDGWQIGGFTLGTDDTPGEANPCETEPPDEPDPLTLPISEVQGPGDTSPVVGELVTIEGVVVGDYQGDGETQLGGFNLQEETADQDGDPLTSEGIFVFAPAAPDVEVGEVVSVTGTVVEFFGMTQISNVADVTVTGFAPEEVIAVEVSLPVTAISDFERYEGMLVTFPQDLYISEFFNFDRFGEIVLTTDRQYQGTHVAEPGPAANAVAAANALARITLDDTRNHQNPETVIHPDGQPFTLDHTFRGGDIVQNVTGTVHFGFGLYRIQPVYLDQVEGVDGPSVIYIDDNPRPTTPDPVGGDVTVASFNVLNFFTHIDDGSNICGPTGNLNCRGADSEEEFQRQLDKLVAGVLALDADIVGIQEIENDILESDGDRAHDAVLTLVEKLNAADRGSTWAWVGEADHYNDYPVRNDIIYRRSKVTPVGDPVALADEAFDATRPGDIEPLGRPPLAQTFRPHGPGAMTPFTVVVNHFKSKGSSCASIGDPDVGDGQGNCNLTRVAQSEALLEFVDELSAASPAGVLVIGDLNSYAMEDPITTLKEGGLTDLVEQFVGADAYSFVFDGQLGYLDTALADETLLARVTGTTIFHINADEPDILDYDTSFKSATQAALYEPLPYRVSDHDPVIIGLEFVAPSGKGRGGGR